MLRFLIPLLLLVSCVPYVDQSEIVKQNRPPLLAGHEHISEIKVIEGQIEIEGFKGRVFEFVGQRLHQESERLLRKQARWSEDKGLTLHLEIKSIRLRKNAAVLFLWQVAGFDEMGIKVWITRAGEVVASEDVTTIYDAGGTYGTNSSQRRLTILSDQIAHKMVKLL